MHQIPAEDLKYPLKPGAVNLRQKRIPSLNIQYLMVYQWTQNKNKEFYSRTELESKPFLYSTRNQPCALHIIIIHNKHSII